MISGAPVPAARRAGRTQPPSSARVRTDPIMHNEGPMTFRPVVVALAATILLASAASSRFNSR
jgi:hypothetical protein